MWIDFRPAVGPEFDGSLGGLKSLKLNKFTVRITPPPMDGTIIGGGAFLATWSVWVPLHGLAPLLLGWVPALLIAALFSYLRWLGPLFIVCAIVAFLAMIV
jgi:hypothetical protein